MNTFKIETYFKDFYIDSNAMLKLCELKILQPDSSIEYTYNDVKYTFLRYAIKVEYSLGITNIDVNYPKIIESIKNDDTSFQYDQENKQLFIIKGNTKKTFPIEYKMFRLLAELGANGDTISITKGLSTLVLNFIGNECEVDINGFKVKVNFKND